MHSRHFLEMIMHFLEMIMHFLDSCSCPSTLDLLERFEELPEKDLELLEKDLELLEKDLELLEKDLELLEKDVELPGFLFLPCNSGSPGDLPRSQAMHFHVCTRLFIFRPE
jgi:hypothetical protein